MKQVLVSSYPLTKAFDGNYFHSWNINLNFFLKFLLCLSFLFILVKDFDKIINYKFSCLIPWCAAKNELYFLLRKSSNKKLLNNDFKATYNYCLETFTLTCIILGYWTQNSISYLDKHSKEEFSTQLRCSFTVGFSIVTVFSYTLYMYHWHISWFTIT